MPTSNGLSIPYHCVGAHALCELRTLSSFATWLYRYLYFVPQQTPVKLATANHVRRVHRKLPKSLLRKLPLLTRLHRARLHPRRFMANYQGTWDLVLISIVALRTLLI